MARKVVISSLVLAVFGLLGALTLLPPDTRAAVADSAAPATETAPAVAAEVVPEAAVEEVAPAGSAELSVPAYAFEERVMGKADAPLTIYEYAMLTCSHCADLHTGAMKQLKEVYVDSGLVRIVYRDYPFDQVAIRAAAAAHCVAPENYFTFVDSLFMQQPVWVGAKDPLLYVKQLAGMAGLEPALFDLCISDQKLIDHLLAMRVEADTKYQINSTPTFVFEDGIEKMVGAQSFEQYAAVIDRKLKDKGVTPPAHNAK